MHVMAQTKIKMQDVDIEELKEQEIRLENIIDRGIMEVNSETLI